MGKGKWDPWRGMDEFRQHVERILDEGRAGLAPASACGYVWAPLADMLETAQAIIAQVELPGIKADQVLVEIVDGDLVVRGERPCERSAACGDSELANPSSPASQPDLSDPTYHLMERAHGIFARRFPLPPGMDAKNTTARLADGLLTITVPKGSAKMPARFSLVVE